jgi:hypothetical protein
MKRVEPQITTIRGRLVQDRFVTNDADTLATAL